MMAPVRTLGGTQRAASLCHRCGVSMKKGALQRLRIFFIGCYGESGHNTGKKDTQWEDRFKTGGT